MEIGGSGGDSTGAGMVISETEPVDKVDGMQWLDATTSEVFIWDEDKWLQFPAGSEGGGSSSGGGGWSYIETIEGSGVSAFEFDLDPSEFSAYRFFVDVNPANSSGTGAELRIQLGSDSGWLDAREYQHTSYCGMNTNYTATALKDTSWTLIGNHAYTEASHWDITLAGIRAGLAEKPSINFSGAGSAGLDSTKKWMGAGYLIIPLSQ